MPGGHWKLTERQVEEIKAAEATTPDQQLADRFGVTQQRISQIRIQGRAERAEIAKAIKARRLEEDLPDALGALAECLAIARERMRETKDPEYIRETRATAVAMLDRVAGPAEYRQLVDTLTDEQLDAEYDRVLALAAATARAARERATEQPGGAVN